MIRVLAAGFALCLWASAYTVAQDTDSASGLIIAEGWETVRSVCTECHSAQLITANAGSRSVWQSRIRWMQDSQGMQALAAAVEATILDYLAAEYGPRQASRRAGLPAALLPANPYPLQSTAALPAAR